MRRFFFGALAALALGAAFGAAYDRLGHANLLQYNWAGAAPANTALPTISGTPLVPPTVMTCNPGTWTGTPTITFTYQWKRDAANISGETATTHTLVTADQGHALTCAVTGTNTFGNSTATSAATNIPSAGPDPTVIARQGTVTGYTNATSAASYDWSYTIATPTGSNAALFVFEARYKSGSPPPNTSTFVVDPAGANISCGQIGIGMSNGNVKSSVWYCPVGSIAGAKTVRATYADATSTAQGGCIMEYSGVGQTLSAGVEGANTTATILNTAITTTVSATATGDWLMGFTLNANDDSFSAPTAPMVQRNPPSAPTSCSGTWTNVVGGSGMDSNGTVGTGTSNVTGNVPALKNIWQHAWAIKHG